MKLKILLCAVLCMLCAAANAQEKVVSLSKVIEDSPSAVRLQSGVYTTGPDPVVLKPGTTITGNGASTIIKPVAGTRQVFIMAADTALKDFTIDGKEVVSGGVADGVIHLGRADHCVISGISFADCDRACIVTDHINDLRIQNNRFVNVALAVSLQFSYRVWIQDSYIEKCKTHGIQFWGNWEFQNKDMADITITGNQVKDGGGGAIWGTGGRRVVVANNIVDGAKDVGIDLEWCDDSSISGNVVKSCENGGISLFLSCQRISITGNTILNDCPITDPKAEWWVRSGIWLTYPNKQQYKDDNGHRDISIVGNTIWCDKGERRAIWIGSESKNVLIKANVITGADCYYGGMHQTKDPLKKFKPDTIIK